MSFSPELIPDEEHTTVKGYARWFISLRWIAVAVATVLIVLAVHVFGLLPEAVLPPMIGLVLVLAGLNVLYVRLLRRGQGIGRLVAFQAYADLILLTALIHYSGGIENPLILLMIFHVVIAGIMLSRRQCYVVALAATALVALLAWAEAREVVEHYTLRLVPHFEEHGHLGHAAHDPTYATLFVGLYGGILMLTAFFVTSLSERLRRKEHQLEHLAERALTQRQLLERALETTGTGLLVCDTELEPILTNARGDAWLARARTDPAFHDHTFGEHAALRRTLADGLVHVGEVALSDEAPPSADTPARTFQTTTAPLVDKEGRITHVVQLIQDITDQKAAQARMLRAGQLAAVGELAGHVAHEVNNPIAIISTKARLLLADHAESLSAHTAQELEKIVDLADRVARIAQGLLSYCRPSVATRMPLDAGIPMRRALAMIEQRAAHAGIVIEDRVPPELPPVNVNAQEVEQVFLNLFLNALDAMPDGGTLRLSAATEDDGRTLCLCVEDTGEGMPEEVRRRIFEPFFTTKPEGKGTGLGLSICHGLIQHYGGRIEVESAPGKGTLVKVYLPVHHLQPEPHHG